MKKYVITRSMNRKDCCALIKKINLEFLESFVLNKINIQLTKSFALKKKSNLFRNKKNIYTSISTHYKGIKLFIVKPEKIGFIIIYDISPIDAPYVQYLYIDNYVNYPTIITQHLLDRYNERILNKTVIKYKELIIDFIVNTTNKFGNHLTTNLDSKEIIQRFDKGFIFGSENKDYTVFNTIYESIEEKDNDLKNHARKSNLNWNNLDSSQQLEYGNLYSQLESGQITDEEFSKQLFLKKLNI